MAEKMSVGDAAVCLSCGAFKVLLVDRSQWDICDNCVQHNRPAQIVTLQELRALYVSEHRLTSEAERQLA